MKACVKAWQDIFNEKGPITDEFGLKALDAIKYGPLRTIKELTFEVSDDMAEEFRRLYPDFRYDHLDIMTDEAKKEMEDDEK